MAGDFTATARNETVSWQCARCGRRVLFALNRKPVGAEIDAYALGLMTVLIELIAQHDDCDRKRADHEIKHVGAAHRGLSLRRHEIFASV